jgi:purine-nucleoside/S-methyl-5'-thioadenosine phosphorylase / adenosine deaminase
MVITPDWPAPGRVRCAFTLRSGGVSVAPYDTLNVGAHVGDSTEAVAENRRRVRECLRLPAEPVWLQQVHGTDVVDLDVLEGGARARADAAVGADAPRGWRATGSGALELRSDGRRAVAASPRADAAVTRVGQRVCVIQVADCMPVLLAARDGSAVGAAHAGWRGLAGGVLEQTVRALAVPPAGLLAWLGPAISERHFEVGDDVRTAFVAGDSGAAAAFVTNTRGRWQCDLYALARRRLAALGVRNVFGGGWCTYGDAARFFSFRRDGQCGRMAALIWLE